MIRTIARPGRKSNSLIVYHRRFLLHQKFGRSWCAKILNITRERGRPVTQGAISHVVAADWPSRGLEIEDLIADALGLDFSVVWPEYARVKVVKVNREVGTAEGEEAPV